MNDRSKQKQEIERLAFLAKLPTFLNSSLDPNTIIGIALKHLGSRLEAEAATVFLLEFFLSDGDRIGEQKRDKESKQLVFWATHGKPPTSLKDLRVPANQGIVGWSLTKDEAVISNDVKSDERFFSRIDEKTEFKTKSLLCVPLRLRDGSRVGAVQVLNKQDGQAFTESDLDFLTSFCSQIALALQNAQLYHDATRRNHLLTSLNKRKDEMISVITHEFRTPLNIIQNSVELLTEHQLPEEQQKGIARTVTNGISRLTAVVSKIRDVSLLTHEQIKTNVSRVDCLALFESLRNEFEPICESRNLTFQTIVPEDPPGVMADPILLAICLRNLLSNAIRFTPNDGAIRLSLEFVENVENMCRISVHDDGIGIADDDKELIFEKFYEVGSSLAHSSGTYEFQSGGLGLGLPSVKGILEAHDSRVEISSTLGEGSTFSFVLPIAA